MVRAQGLAPERAAANMTAAEGFEVELVASEPRVRQPVAIEFDDRGRLWVIQYLQYPNPAGLKRVKVDRYSRTEYDRIPEPPPHGPKGADRITILEDTDGDGRADRSKDFVDGLNLASGLAFGHGGVFVLNVPYLLFYPDRDRDDVPDGDPRVLLKGFGMHDAHSVANSLTWGPDGWLYGCQGSTVTANIRGIEFQQGVWRYQPLTDEFELFCEGGGNSWGLDFDRAGSLIYSTNYGGHVALHGVQGAYLVKSFGKHGALHNPYAFGYFEHIAHDDFRGGHVTVGGTFYYGTTFPERFRGKYIGGDLLGHAVYWHAVTPHGSTLRSAHGGDLLAANDTWFAPSDLTLGPDGAIYATDWHDRRTAHPDPDADWDRSNGRIFRIQWEDAEPEPHVDLNDLTSAQLVDWLDRDNNWYVRRARRILAERQDAGLYPGLKQLACETDDGQLALEALWALHASGGLDEQTAQRLLKHRDENIRAWAVRLMGDDCAVSAGIADSFVELAKTDPSSRVRSQLACTARRLPVETAIPLVVELLKRDADADDPHIPLLLWWAVERHAIAGQDRWLGRLTAPQMLSRRMVRDVVVERLMKRYAAAGELEACARLLRSSDTGLRRRLLVALDEGLRLRSADKSTGFGDGTLFSRFAPAETGRSATTQTEPSDPVIDEAGEAVIEELQPELRSASSDPVVLRIAVGLGSRPAAEGILNVAIDSAADAGTRVAMLDVLAELGDSGCVRPLLELIDADQPEQVQVAALDALGRFDAAAIPKQILAAYDKMSPELKAKAREKLFGRRSWAKVFLLQFEAGRFPSEEVTLAELRRIALHQDAELDALVRKHWGEVRAGTPGEKLAEMRRLNNDLRAADGDASNGQELFKKHCAACHRLFDDGNRVGPDLTHANRQDREFLLASLVDPSAQIRKEYLSYIIQTSDGRVLTGLIADQSPAEITLLDAKNQRMRIAMEDVEALKESEVSLMPEDVLKPLSPQELRDLFAYIEQSPRGNSSTE